MSITPPKDQVNFITYIRNTLKALHPDGGFKKQALLEVNSLVDVVGKQTLAKAEELAIQKGQKTLFAENVHRAATLLFGGGLSSSAKLRASKEEGGKTVNVKIPAARAGHYLKAEFRGAAFINKTALRVGKGVKNGRREEGAADALAKVLNDFLVTLLEAAKPDKGKVYLKARNIRQAAEKKDAIHSFFQSQGIVLARAGVAATGIHDALMPATTSGGNRKYTKRKGDTSGHRYRPGTVALRNITKLQQSDAFMLQQAPFSRLVRASAEAGGYERVSSKAFSILQSYVESAVVALLHQANRIAINAKRQTVAVSDIEIAKDGCDPFKTHRGGHKAGAGDEVKNGGIRRLASQGGVKRLSVESYDYLRGCIAHMVSSVMKAAVVFTENAAHKTVTGSDVVKAIETVYGKKIAADDVKRRRTKKQA